MRLILAMSALLLIPSQAMAMRITDHPTMRGHKLVVCDDGRRSSFPPGARVYERARAFCREDDRRPSSSAARTNSPTLTPGPTRSTPGPTTSRTEPSAPRSQSSSSAGSIRCSATRLPIEDEWKPGRVYATLSVPRTRPLTGSYDRNRHTGDTVCVGATRNGKREQLQYRCGKDGEWQFVQRLWARQNDCRDDGTIAIN